ncbi:hypothetical protein SLA_3881 [Streptomyces laurentii]|uniref:Uncharacterized protein n=1 Tax=Streptomyces laurentii TaxID=39478 RepID=A0A169NNU0_STRLU|nr:hypothetical protein SLA_3881 [Streptomyces laurentii]
MPDPKKTPGTPGMPGEAAGAEAFDPPPLPREYPPASGPSRASGSNPGPSPELGAGLGAGPGPEPDTPDPDANPEADPEADPESERRRRRAQFLRDLHEAKALRERVQPRRARAARMRQAMRMRSFRW